MQKKRYWLPLIFLCFAFIVPRAYAACPLTDYQSDFLKADSVFVGKIISRDTKTQRANVRVSYSWKGPQWGNPTILMPQVIADRFQIDDNGLYYAHVSKDHSLSLDPCSLSQPLDQASEFTLYLFMHIGFWLTCIFLLRFAFIFTFRFLSQSIVPLLYSLIAATGLSLLLPDYLLEIIRMPFIAQFAIAPLIFLICLVVGLLFGMSRKEMLVTADSVKPFGIALTLFAVTQLLVAIFFQPITVLMASASAILIADSWRSGIRFEPIENAMKHRFRSTIFTLVSFALILVAVGVFFKRWMSV